MTDALAALPHEIPFRALTSIDTVEGDSASGTFLGSACDALAEGAPLPPVLLVEAMAQLGGSIVFRSGQGAAFLSALSGVTLEAAIHTGERYELRVRLEASLGTVHRFRGTASCAGAPAAEATFTLSSSGEAARG